MAPRNLELTVVSEKYVPAPALVSDLVGQMHRHLGPQPSSSLDAYQPEQLAACCSCSAVTLCGDSQVDESRLMRRCSSRLCSTVCS